MITHAPEVMSPKDQWALSLPMMLVLVFPFYANDFANIFVDDWRLWLLIDYTGVKLLPLAIIAWLLTRGRLHPRDLGLTYPGTIQFLGTFLIVTLVGTLIDQNGYAVTSTWPGYQALGGMPPIGSPVWDWIDLTFGLLLVGIVEELVFRGYMLAFLRRYTTNRLVIVVVSSIAFGLIHWSLGLNAVLITTIIGSVFMTAYLATGSLPAIMLAHFAVNFIDFAGIIPKSIFKLL